MAVSKVSFHYGSDHYGACQYGESAMAQVQLGVFRYGTFQYGAVPVWRCFGMAQVPHGAFQYGLVDNSKRYGSTGLRLYSHLVVSYCVDKCDLIM